MAEAGLGATIVPAVVLMGAAVVAVPLFRRLGLGSVLGYFAAGVLVGPLVIGLFTDTQSILHFSELGVVMFLFVIGLELRPRKLWAIRDVGQRQAAHPACARTAREFGEQSMSSNADDDRILRSNLKNVFGERDAEARAAAIRELYAQDAVLYEPESIAAGHDEIGRAVEALLTSLPPDFAFAPLGPAAAHHGLACLRWRSGPAEGPPVVTGMDVARIERGRIKSLHVFIDPAGF